MPQTVGRRPAHSMMKLARVPNSGTVKTRGQIGRCDKS